MGIGAAATSAEGQVGSTGATSLENFARKERKRELISTRISCVQTLYRKTHPETQRDAMALVNGLYQFA